MKGFVRAHWVPIVFVVVALTWLTVVALFADEFYPPNVLLIGIVVYLVWNLWEEWRTWRIL